ncbi:MAG: hypothetical protein GX621_18810 [Pirellulaceae bacterium]|nr:hypothetical protein [Pirellulaceae bacterium]
MPNEIKTKKTFGTATIDHFSPPKESEWPKAINITISFEEALRLHLGLGQLLGKLNTYNRATKPGRESAVNLCVYTQARRITINKGRVKRDGAEAK